MEFWFIISAMAVLVAAILILSMSRRVSRANAPAAFDVQVYRDQLAEVDRDLARGVIDPADAERVRTEVSRRILAADAAATASQSQDQGHTSRVLWWGVICVILLAGSGYTYLKLGAPGYGDLALKDRIEAAADMRAERPSQADAEATLAQIEQPNAPEPNADYLRLVEQLRGVVKERPDDPQGARLLAVSERNLGNFTAAYTAFQSYLTLRGADASGAEYADYADMKVLAAGGYVSPEAEQALSEALRRDPRNGIARYYWGLMLNQTGRPDQAFRIWDALLREGPREAPWIDPILEQIEEASIRAGVTYSIPEIGSLRGPSQSDVDAAGEMNAADRMEMIQGMVAGLSERLATDGGTYQEWGQLITALGVLGRFDDAEKVYLDAVQTFAENPTALDFINRAGQRAGVAE